MPTAAGWPQEAQTRTVRIWAWPEGTPAGEFTVDTGRVYGLGWSMDKPPRYVTAGDGEGEAVIWDVKRTKRAGAPHAHQGPAHAISYFPGGHEHIPDSRW